MRTQPASDLTLPIADPVFRALQVDVERTRALLPPELRDLADLAWNFAWCWLREGPALFREIDPEAWERSRHNPRAAIEQAGPRRLAELAADPAFRARLARVSDALRERLSGPPAPEGERVRERLGGRPVAYFCAEFGIHECLPIYAGGLGVLAGDHLKSASDLGIPLVAVGLRYRQGYFHQWVDRAGWQTEYYEDIPFGQLPTGLILKPDRTPLTVQVPFHGRRVVLQIWGALVGRTPLILLDSDRDDNDPIDRWITAHLYGGGTDTRLAQEMVLGIGGVRALRALGYDPGVFHMNEGHAAFLALELIREGLARGQMWEEAVNAARSRTVFTTHTPVKAGHDVFRYEQISSFMADYLASFHEGAFPVPHEKILGLGRKYPDDPHEDFSMTHLAMRTSRSINAVSRLHGEVSREMWHWLWPGLPAEKAPIRHVTNGVHLGSWMAPLMRELLDGYLGPDWERRQADPETWAGVDAIPDEELWSVHCTLKRRFIQFARERVRAFRQAIGDPPEFIRAADEALDPDALTFGFARRVATYKRLNLLVHDPDRALSLLNLPGRPVQILIAGKAHPGDSEAKRVLQYLFQTRYDPRFSRRAAFLVDYDIAVAREMVQGCDVWLNLPRRPLEASGTSGMKAGLNGVLHCSVLDGWWAEGYNGRNGWAIGSTVSDPDTARQDAADAASLYETIERKIVPLYFERDSRGVPRRWVAMMKEALKSIGPVFNTDRMLRDYGSIYAP